MVKQDLLLIVIGAICGVLSIDLLKRLQLLSLPPIYYIFGVIGVLLFISGRKMHAEIITGFSLGLAIRSQITLA